MSAVVVMEAPRTGQVDLTAVKSTVHGHDVFPSHGCQGPLGRIGDPLAPLAPEFNNVDNGEGGVENCLLPGLEWETDLDRTGIHSFKFLLRMYSMHANRGGTERQVTMGGFQQFLNKKLHRPGQNEDKLNECKQLRKGYGTNQTTVFDLPECVQLHIFSYMGARELCILSRVCKKWYDISWDEILWKKKLQLDVHKWKVIGHTTNPDMYSECDSDLSYKQIYLQCCPEVQRILLQQNLGFHQLSGLLRSLWPRKRTPRMAMFGPGLETSTSKIARKMLEDNTGMFKTTGMFPGQFEGVGSGFTMKMKDAVSFHLITLYTSTRKERENFNNNQRMQHNRLLDHRHPVGARDPEAGEAAATERFEVRQAIRDLCRTLDAYIFVVDASSEELVESARPELMAMVQELWPCPGVPVLVLSCSLEASKPSVSCMSVARHLQLSKLNRPWQVHQCSVNTMSGVCEGIEWAVQQAQRS